MIGLIPYIIKALLGDNTGKPTKKQFDSTKDYTGYANGKGFFGSPVDYQSKIKSQQSVMLQTQPKVFVPRGSTNIRISEFKPTLPSPSAPTTTNKRQFR